ncbi:hypothetical protein TARUN_9557 [Trichoderma arundinaceum]|uniref:Uncharacterized protein n=1 Tax=Trichoderma arundinaceum TaxID=490622 RepID=A0A395N9A0_TRIAR|nr:hypothetical protein TARUN_9557 [Trichoderma arundinaceum]
MHSNLLALAFTVVGALAVDPTNITAEQAISILEDIVDSLQAAGDLRVKLQQATPNLNEQNAAPVYQSLADSFAKTQSLFPNNNGDVNIGTTTAEQSAAVCALVPKLLAAGTHASDALASQPDFQDSNGSARTAALSLGGILENVGWNLNMFHWGFITAGIAATCDQGTQNDFYTVPNQLMDAGTAIFY